LVQIQSGALITSLNERKKYMCNEMEMFEPLKQEKEKD
jgi:hypothetical protein